MLKFFRKYNKWMLVIFMTMLMIVFVAGSALQSLFTPETNVVIAKSDFGDIDTQALRKAKNSTNILDVMGLNWRHPYGSANEPLTPVDWIILNSEAQSYQANASRSAVQSWLKQQANAQDLVDSVARRIGVKPDRVIAAIGEYLSVQLAAQAVAAAVAPSAAEVRLTARNALGKVKVKALVLPASTFAEDDTDVAESELGQQWEPYKDVKPGSGLNFGYYVEPKLTVQLFKIDRDAIAENIHVPNHEKRAKRYFQENRESDPAFQLPPSETPTLKVGEDGKDQPGEDGDASDKETEERSRFVEWEAGKQAAMDSVRNQHAAAAAERIASWLCNYDAEHWLGVKRNEDGYKTVPAEVAKLDYYDTMIGQIPKSLAYTDAVTVTVTEPFFKDTARDVSDIGASFYRTDRKGVQTFSRVAFRSQPIVPSVPVESGADVGDYLSTFKTCPYPLGDSLGNLYVFRVVDVEPGHASESVDEVRERVVADLHLLHGYEIAQSWAAMLTELGSTQGIEGAFRTDDELEELFASQEGGGGGLYESLAVSRVDRGLAALGLNLDTVFAGAGIGQVSADVVHGWFGLEDTVDHLGVYELRDRAVIIVAEWMETVPASYDEFEQLKGTLATQLSRTRRQKTMSDWFEPDRIHARSGFKLVKN